MTLFADTSCLYALLDKDDKNHRKVASFVEGIDEMILVPDVILPELSYLVNKFLGVDVEVRFLLSLAQGEVGLEFFAFSDLKRVVDLISTYKDEKIGFVDAAIVAMAERLNITKILTFDNHFRIIGQGMLPRLKYYLFRSELEDQ